VISNEQNGEQSPKVEASKKIYKSPELTVYGPIEGLTLNNKQRGKLDSGARRVRRHT